MNFIDSIRKTISDHDMLQPGDSVLVAVSGGPDSVALLHVMLELSDVFSLNLGIAHLNHSLRGRESDRDAVFVELMAKRLNLPVYISKKDVRKYQKEKRLSPEDAARRVRYSFFYETAESHGFTKIALGHHADDNAELVLMNILRGSGHRGMSGIPPLRGGLTDEKAIIRPLIKSTRDEILFFLKKQGLKYVIDRSNYDTSLLRNRIRRNLIPELKKNYNPEIIQALNRLAAIIRAEENWIDNLTNSILEKNCLPAQDNNLNLSIPGLTGLDIAALRRITRKGIQKIKGGLKRITFSHINSIIKLLKCGPSLWSLDLPDRIRIRRKYDTLIISKEKNPLRETIPDININELPAFEYIISQPEQESPFFLFLDRLNIYMKFSIIDIVNFKDITAHGRETAFLDMEALDFPLTIRNIKPGDRFYPLGLQGSQKVKKYFINQKTDKTKRAHTPVLLSLDRIIWLVGHRIDESVKIKHSTRQALRVDILRTFCLPNNQ
jgi:tRNA(Ile)-lysidine synthase